MGDTTMSVAETRHARSMTGVCDFRVLANEPAAEGIWRMRISTEVAAGIAPGQFVNLHVPGNAAHILRIPLSFADADAGAHTMDLLYATVGEGTRRLAQMAPGDSSTLVGPCGVGWRLPARTGRALLVAGGVGLPPVLAAAHMLADHGIGFDMAVGARTHASHIFPECDDVARWGAAAGEDGGDSGRRVVLVTDDGTAATGRAKPRYATDAMEELLSQRSYTQVYTCGPTPMMARVARIAAERDIACQASLERMMGCGFGACSCCNVELVSGGYALCCTDGPVFDAREVVW